MVLSKEAETPYMRPPLSKELWLAAEAANEKSARAKETADTEALKFKQWNGVERSLYYEPNDFYIHPSKLLSEPNGGVAIVRGYTVDRIDVQNRVAILSDGTEIKYGKCLIATGSTPKNLDVFESAPANIKERISLFKTIEDFGNLRRNVDNSKSVAIVGGGFLGSELACALAKYGVFGAVSLEFFSNTFQTDPFFFDSLLRRKQKTRNLPSVPRERQHGQSAAGILKRMGHRTCP